MRLQNMILQNNNYNKFFEKKELQIRKVQSDRFPISFSGLFNAKETKKLIKAFDKFSDWYITNTLTDRLNLYKKTEKCLKRGANPNAKLGEYSLLDIALLHDLPEIEKLLLKYGGKVSKKSIIEFNG